MHAECSAESSMAHQTLVPLHFHQGRGTRGHLYSYLTEPSSVLECRVKQRGVWVGSPTLHTDRQTKSQLTEKASLRFSLHYSHVQVKPRQWVDSLMAVMVVVTEYSHWHFMATVMSMLILNLLKEKRQPSVPINQQNTRNENQHTYEKCGFQAGKHKLELYLHSLKSEQEHLKCSLLYDPSDVVMGNWTLILCKSNENS